MLTLFCQATEAWQNFYFMDYQKILEDIHQEILPYAEKGKQADYIPALAKVNPDQFGICLKTVTGESYSYKQADERFSIQSIAKVFALAMGLSLKGEALWKNVGKEPSGTAFNSLVQLEMEHGIPRNPFINAGAIVVADLLLTELDDAEGEYLKFVRALCGNDSVDYNMEVAMSERATGHLNAAIANMLKYHGTIENDIEDQSAIAGHQLAVIINAEVTAAADRSSGRNGRAAAIVAACGGNGLGGRKLS